MEHKNPILVFSIMYQELILLLFMNHIS